MIRPSHSLAATFAGAAIALLTLAGPVAAQEATYLSESASYCDMFRGLSKVVPGHCAAPGDLELAPSEAAGVGKTRGIRAIRMHDADRADAKPYTLTAAEAAPEPAPVQQMAPPKDLAIAMRVQFEYDSFRLTAEAKQVLDRVAGVLKDEIMQGTFVQVEGHADAHGPDDYNLSLSQLRAREVRTYLVEQHALAPDRLPFAGKGESQPFDAADPYNGINRRVEFRNLSG